MVILGITGYIGIDLTLFSESMRIWGTGSVVYPIIMLKDIISSTVIVFITAVIASVYPAVKAARIKPFP